MKKLVLVLATLLALVIPAHAGPLDKKVTLQFASIDMWVVLAQLSSEVGLSFIHDHDGPAPRVSVTAVDDRAFRVLDDLTTKYRMQYMVSGKALIVGYPRMVAQYRDITPLVVKYKHVKPQEAFTIVQNVFPYVDGTVQPDGVKFVVPKIFLGQVKDIAVALDKAH